MSDIDKYTEKHIDEHAYDYKTTTSNFRNRKLWVCKEYFKEEHDGYVLVKFKVGVTNHIWWSKSFSTVWSGISTAASTINESEKVQKKYFDKKSGKLIPFDELAALSLEQEAKKLLNNDQLNEAKLKLEEAFSKSKIIYLRIRNSLESIKLAIEAKHFLEQHHYEDAFDLFQEAYNKSTEIEFYTKFKHLRDSIEAQAEKEREEREERVKQELKRVQLNSTAEKLFTKGYEYYKSGDYHKAIDKFQEAYLKSTSGFANEYKYLWWKADCLFKIGSYSEAIQEYDNAISIIIDPTKKQDCTKQRNDCLRRQLKKEKKSQLLKIEEEALKLVSERKFQEAEAKFKKALNDSQTDTKLRERFQNLLDLIQLAMDGLTLAYHSKYEDAYLKFEEAYFKSNEYKLYKLFLNEMDSLKPFADEQKRERELKQLVLGLEQDSIDLANQMKFSDALVKLNEAKSKCKDTQLSAKLKNSIDAIKIAIEANDKTLENNLNEAFSKYHEAFQLANDVLLRNKFLILMNSIKLKRNQKATQLFEKGKYLSSQNKHAEAVFFFDKAKQEDSDDSMNKSIYSWWKADSLKRNHNYNEAINEYDLIIATTSDLVIKNDCLIQREDCVDKLRFNQFFEQGQDLNMKGEHIKAIEMFSQAKDGNLDDKHLYLVSWWRADSLNKLARFEEAIIEYNYAITKVVNSVEKDNCIKQRDECIRNLNKCDKEPFLFIDSKQKFDLEIERSLILDLVDIKLALSVKLEGNKYLNEGYVWQRLADKLSDEAYETNSNEKLAQAKENYMTALELLNKSKLKFMEGLNVDSRLDNCVKMVEATIGDVNNNIKEIEDSLIENNSSDEISIDIITSTTESQFSSITQI